MFLTTVALDDIFQLGEDAIIIDPGTGRPLHQWVIQSTVKNAIDVRYDYNRINADGTPLARDAFGRRQVYQAEASVEKYGPEPTIVMEFRGIDTNLGGQTIMDNLSLAFLQRWAYPPPFLRLSVVYQKHPLEILDSVRVTHSKIQNPITGLIGIKGERFEIIDIAPQFQTAGRLDLLLLWVGAIETSAAPVSGGEFTLVPGIQVSYTEPNTAVPLGSFVQFDLPASGTSNAAGVRIGLAHRSYRIWQCVFEVENYGEL
jgi:hypothetical protein